MCHRDPCQPTDLFEGQQLVSLHEREVLAEDRPRHAVDTAEVAPIGDRDAQVPQSAIPDISDRTPVDVSDSTGMSDTSGKWSGSNTPASNHSVTMPGRVARRDRHTKPAQET